MKLWWPLLKLIKRTHRIDSKYFFFQMFCFPFSFTTFDCHGGNCLTELHFKKPSKSFFAFFFFFFDYFALENLGCRGVGVGERGLSGHRLCKAGHNERKRKQPRSHLGQVFLTLSLSHTSTHTHTLISLTHTFYYSLSPLSLSSHLGQVANAALS
jgi:hypothetical protein